MMRSAVYAADTWTGLNHTQWTWTHLNSSRVNRKNARADFLI